MKKKTAKKKASKKKATTRKKAAKKPAARKPAKKKSSARKPARAKTKSTSKKLPPSSGELVRTRPGIVAKRLLGPSTTSGGESASGGLSYSNPARAAMLRKLMR